MNAAAGVSGPVEVFIETGRKRVFACALDWPGWARSARTEQLALETLTDYLPRFAPVVRRAGLTPPGTELVVVERAEGTAGYTDFGVPGIVAERDSDQIVEHVIGAEAAFSRKLGVRPPGKPQLADQAATAAMRAAIVAALRESPDELAGGWPARYAVRRIGWHVLDHA